MHLLSLPELAFQQQLHDRLRLDTRWIPYLRTKVGVWVYAPFALDLESAPDYRALVKRCSRLRGASGRERHSSPAFTSFGTIFEKA